MQYMFGRKQFRRLRACLALLTAGVVLVISLRVIPPTLAATTCTTTAACQAAQNAAQKAAAAAAAAAAQQRQAAQNAAQAATQAANQITLLQSSLQQTATQLTTTQGQIQEKTQEIAQDTSEESDLQNKLEAMVRELWIAEQTDPDSLTSLLGNNSTISSSSKTQADFMALEQSVAEVYAQTEAAKQQVATALAQLDQQNLQLQGVQQQQSDQKTALAAVKANQLALQENASAAATQLTAQAQQQQQLASQFAAKIQLLQSTNWVGSGGGDLVTSDPSWYYTQVGDNTRLGYTYYTVAQVGCLITSIAMVATFYGHNISPDYIAENGYFSSAGYYTSGTPAGLGVTVQGSTGVNWNTINSQLAAGHPVIVGLYFPSIGRVNSDGSSHYVVLYGKTDAGKYLTADPLNNRNGYLASQVVSMRVVIPN